MIAKEDMVSDGTDETKEEKKTARQIEAGPVKDMGSEIVIIKDHLASLSLIRNCSHIPTYWVKNAVNERVGGGGLGEEWKRSSWISSAEAFHQNIFEFVLISVLFSVVFFLVLFSADE